MIKPLQLTDLKPQEFEITLSARPKEKLTLKKFSLAEQIWCEQHFGPERIKAIFEKQDLPGMAEIAHHLIKEPNPYPTFLEFASDIVTMQDKINVIQGLLATIGLSKPVIQKLAKEAAANQTPKQKTPSGAAKQPIGAKPSTTSPPNTGTP